MIGEFLAVVFDGERGGVEDDGVIGHFFYLVGAGISPRFWFGLFEKFCNLVIGKKSFFVFFVFKNDS